MIHYLFTFFWALLISAQFFKDYAENYHTIRHKQSTASTVEKADTERNQNVCITVGRKSVLLSDAAVEVITL